MGKVKYAPTINIPKYLQDDTLLLSNGSGKITTLIIINLEGVLVIRKTLRTLSHYYISLMKGL